MTFIRGIVVFAFLLILALGAVAVLVWFTGGVRRPEILLTIVLIVGVMALIAALGGLLALLRNFGLAAPTEALGLPPGSVRAVLALMLVLIFATTTIFIYYNSVDGGSRSTGLTLAQVERLPQDQIVAINLRPQPTPPATPGPDLYDVTLKASQESTQLGQQLITLIGTLVTAVAAFYFGSSSVVTAIKAQTPRAGTPPDAKSARAKAAASQAVADAAAAEAKRDAALATALESANATAADSPNADLGSPPPNPDADKPGDPNAAPAPAAEPGPDMEIREGS